MLAIFAMNDRLLLSAFVTISFSIVSRFQHHTLNIRRNVTYTQILRHSQIDLVNIIRGVQ